MNNIFAIKSFSILLILLIFINDSFSSTTSNCQKNFEETAINNFESVTLNTADKDKFDSVWETFRRVYNKKFNTNEAYNKNFLNFRKNLQKIKNHNEETELGIHSYTLGINKFTDQNVNDLFNHFSLNKNVLKFGSQLLLNTQKSRLRIKSIGVQNIPSNHDWRRHSIIGPVLDQGDCGSCWAFSVSGALESHKAKLKNQLPIQLSMQEMVDCDNENYGCDGGMLHIAFNYTINHGWISNYNDYPYIGRKGKCKRKPDNNGGNNENFDVKCTDFNIVYEDEDDLRKALYLYGPIAVGIHVSEQGNMLFYKSGVFSDVSCSANKINHGVLLVGYGTDKNTGLDYWLIKNSWGESWGESGYIRIRRNNRNMCGVASMAVFPTIETINNLI